MKSFNILVVDDATMIRDLIKKFVRDYFPGAKIFDAHNGQQGKSILIQQPIDLILCDWEMPEMNGMELLGWVRGETKYENLPFIMVTSRGDKQFVVEAIQAGVSDYLVKPFNRQQFAEKVGKSLKRHGVQGSMVEPESSASGSLAVLTAGKTSSPPANKPQAKPQKASAPRKPLPKGAAIVRTPDGEVKCAVKQLDKSYCAGIFKHSTYMPALLDHVSVDIEFKQDGEVQVMRINGFIQSISATEDQPDCQLIQMKIIFMDEDPGKQQKIAEYVTQFN